MSHIDAITRAEQPAFRSCHGDFECPYCGQAYHGTKILRRHFGERMRFVLREMHPHAELAAEAAETAGAQNKFWPMHDVLFENQLHLKAKSLRRYAEEAEFDLERYDYEMGDHVYLHGHAVCNGRDR